MKINVVICSFTFHGFYAVCMGLRSGVYNGIVLVGLRSEDCMPGFCIVLCLTWCS